jgi:hypothetical protein
MKIYRILLFCATIPFISAAQKVEKPLTEVEVELQQSAETMLSDTSAKVRLEAAENISTTLKAVLKRPESLVFAFEKLVSVSKIQPEDKSFRIFTWQLMISQTKYKYYGLIQTNEGKVIPLNDVSEEILRPETAQMSDKRWYGVLYYKLMEFKKGKKSYYALLGYDSYNFYSKRKIMEILSFENGKPKFGHQLIAAKDGMGKPRTFHRYLIQYAGDAQVKFNFDPQLEMIVFDNLILGAGPDGNPANVPDGSFNGLKLDKGEWKLVENIFKDDPVLENGQAPVENKDKKSGLTGPKQ